MWPFSVDIGLMAKPTSLSWVLNFSFEKERSAGTVSKICKATDKLGNTSCKRLSCKWRKHQVVNKRHRGSCTMCRVDYATHQHLCNHRYQHVSHQCCHCMSCVMITTVLEFDIVLVHNSCSPPHASAIFLRTLKRNPDFRRNCFRCSLQTFLWQIWMKKFIRHAGSIQSLCNVM